MQGVKPKVDPFKLSQGDDSWGFEESPLKLRAKLSKTEKVIYSIVIGYFTWLYLYYGDTKF